MAPTRRHAPLALLILAASLTLTACSASVSAGNGAQPSAVPSCTTRSCAAAEIQRSLIGIVVKDGSVMTGAACKAPTAKETGGTWTASCTVTFSDGAKWSGLGNWVTTADKVSFQPQAQVKGAS